MKITDVKVFVVDAYRTNFVFVKLFTDEGLTGVGEGTLEYKEQALVGAINDLKDYLLGKDPLNIELHSYEIYRSSYWRNGVVLQSALSAVEIAMWDIKGKYYNVPVYELLGGKVRDRVRIYANGWFAGSKEPKEFAEKALVAVNKGVEALKWDPFGKAYLNMTLPEYNAAFDCIGAVRDAVGWNVELLIEGHGRFNINTALNIAKELKQYKVLWFEEPVPPDNLDALAEVRAKAGIPIAAGERVYSTYAFREFLEKRCADFCQPDVTHAGGISAIKKMSAMAEPYYVEMAAHNPSGPIANAATLQLAANLPNYFVHEIMLTDVSWRPELTNEVVEFEDGCIKIPNKPGLGLEINEEACAKYPFKAKFLRHYRGDLTDIRPQGTSTIFYFQGID